MASPTIQVRDLMYCAISAYSEATTRINEFNVDDALALFLPYHETPHFTKLLSILHVKYAS